MSLLFINCKGINPNLIEVLSTKSFVNSMPEELALSYDVVVLNNIGQVSKVGEATTVALLSRRNASKTKVMGVMIADMVRARSLRCVVFPLTQRVVLNGFLAGSFQTGIRKAGDRLINFEDKAALMFALQQWLFWARLPPLDPESNQPMVLAK